MWNVPSADRLAKIPRLYETEGIPLKDKLIYLHFFIFGCDFYIAEYDGNDRFFGYSILNEDHVNSEWGYISFKELKSISYKEFQVENDMSWTPRPAAEIPNIKV